MVEENLGCLRRMAVRGARKGDDGRGSEERRVASLADDLRRRREDKAGNDIRNGGTEAGGGEAGGRAAAGVMHKLPAVRYWRGWKEGAFRAVVGLLPASELRHLIGQNAVPWAAGQGRHALIAGQQGEP